jgi:pimeloyl-ACP methyl ester carboxylesterase
MRINISDKLWFGYDEAGTGLPVVLLHAFPLDRRMWWLQRHGLAAVCRVVTPDLRGFGDSAPWDGVPSIDRQAEGVCALLDRLLPNEPVVMGGLSMGGYVTLAFARKYPDRLRGLILADTRADADSVEARANRDKMIAFAGEHTAADVVEQMLPRLLCDATRTGKPDVVEEVRRIGSAQSQEGTIAGLISLRDRPDATSVLKTIRVPTLVIVGSDDTATPPALAEVMATGITGAQLVTIPEAGHLSNLEQTERFNETVRQFVENLSR